MNIIMDPEGGDLGRASSGITRIEQIPYLVMRIGEVFSALREIIPNNRIFSYCFEVRHEYKNVLRELLISMDKEGLPLGCQFYETDGLRVFDIRGASGGIVTSVCFYLICGREK